MFPRSRSSRLTDHDYGAALPGEAGGADGGSRQGLDRMGIAEEIARKRAELADFVAASAAAVLSEEMTAEARGIVALDLLRLLAASGLQAPSTPMIDITPPAPAITQTAPARRAINAPPRKFSDEQLLAAIAEYGNDNNAIASHLGVSKVAVNQHRRRLGVPSPRGFGNRAPKQVAAPSAEELVAAITPKPRATYRKRRFTDEQLLAAVAAHGHDNRAIAAKLGVTKKWINIERARLGVPSPKCGRPNPKAAKHTVQDWPMAPVTWDEGNVAKLRVMATQSPRPSNSDIAKAFGTSLNAIQTVLSRFDITKGNTGRRIGELKDLSGLKERKCLRCQKPFASEGIHNRRCSPCKSNDHRIAA